MIHEIPIAWLNQPSPPMPNGRQAIQGKLWRVREILKTKKSGESFIWDEHRNPYLAAQQLGIKITTRKLDGEGYIVWKR